MRRPISSANRRRGAALFLAIVIIALFSAAAALMTRYTASMATDCRLVEHRARRRCLRLSAEAWAAEHPEAAAAAGEEGVNLPAERTAGPRAALTLRAVEDSAGAAAVEIGITCPLGRRDAASTEVVPRRHAGD
jgi:type II secretory pathway component PulK